MKKKVAHKTALISFRLVFFLSTSYSVIVKYSPRPMLHLINYIEEERLSRMFSLQSTNTTHSAQHINYIQSATENSVATCNKYAI